MGFGKILGNVCKAFNTICSIPGISFLMNAVIPGSGQLLMMANAVLQAANNLKKGGVKGFLRNGLMKLGASMLSTAVAKNFPQATGVFDKAMKVADAVVNKDQEFSTAVINNFGKELESELGKKVVAGLKSKEWGAYAKLLTERVEATIEPLNEATGVDWGSVVGTAVETAGPDFGDKASGEMFNEALNSFFRHNGGWVPPEYRNDQPSQPSQLFPPPEYRVPQ